MFGPAQGRTLIMISIYGDLIKRNRPQPVSKDIAYKSCSQVAAFIRLLN